MKTIDYYTNEEIRECDAPERAREQILLRSMRSRNEIAIKKLVDHEDNKRFISSNMSELRLYNSIKSKGFFNSFVDKVKNLIP